MSKDATKPKKETDLDKATKVADGFINFSTKVGVNYRSGLNNISSATYDFNLVTRYRVQLEAAYRGSWVVGKMVDSVAEDMTRAGIEITTNDDAKNIPKLQTAITRLQIWNSTRFGISLGRLYGGALGILQIEGQKLDTPLNIEAVQKGQFKGISCYDRWQLNPDLTNLITVGPQMGLPEYYYIVVGQEAGKTAPAITPTGQIKVHHSRCIRFIGIELPFWQAITEMMWGESILERAWDRLISFDEATMSSANLIDRASLRTVKLEKLREIIAAGGPALSAVQANFEMIRRFQSNEGFTLLDKEDEFETHQYTFSGLSDMLLQFGQQLGGASDTPLIRLFGQSPSGLSATGEADIRMYYDYINSQQEARLRLPVETLLKVIYQSTFGKPAPEDLEFTFTPLWQMSAKDKAEIAKINTETLIAAHTQGAIDMPTLMTELRDTQGEFGLFNNITDESINEAESEAPLMKELDLQLAKENAKGPEVRTIDSKPKGLLQRFFG